MIRNPKEVLEETYLMTEAKQSKPWSKVILLALMAGVYIAMGGFLSLLVGKGFPGITEANPALGKWLSGITFPVGLILTVITGAELFTSNNAILIPALMKKRIAPLFPLKYWAVVYLANFVGAVAFTYFLVYQTGLLEHGPWREAVQHVAEDKTSLSFGVAFLRGIGANWLVCLAIWLGLAAKDMTGKVLGIWWPVMTFVTLGFEHSIANMFYIPLGMMMGAEVSMGQLLVDNLLPVTLGNIVGGALFVGAFHAYLFAAKK